MRLSEACIDSRKIVARRQDLSGGGNVFECMALDEATSSSGDGAQASAGRGVDWSAELVRHERWLRTVIWARLRDADAVDDVWQELSLAAVRQAAPIDDPAKVGAWLYHVAVRQALMHRRGSGRRRRLGLPAGQADAEWTDPRHADPLGWLLAEERRQLVQRALGELGSRDAEILLLKYTEGWTYQQIADHLGVRRTAVETRLHRARQRMRERIARLESVETSV